MSGPLTLDVLRPCLEGVVPAGIATCGADGMPNVTYVSQLMYVDQEHLALSFQFFNKTRENILANPVATVLTMDPDTAARYRLTVRYLRTETAGPLFERMKAKLAGIASHTGMASVFRLLGADIYRVQAVEPVPGRELPPAWNGSALLPALRRSIDALGRAEGLDGLIDVFCSSLERQFSIQHQMLLMADAARQRLFIVASRGYPSSGAGAEIPYGVGVIGVAARERVPIRIMFPASEYAYGRVLCEQATSGGLAEQLETAIPLPGLAEPASQLAGWRCRYWPAIIWWRWPTWRVSMNATSATIWRTLWWRCAPPSVWRCTCSSARWMAKRTLREDRRKPSPRGLAWPCAYAIFPGTTASLWMTTT